MTPQEVYSPPALHFLIVAFNYSCGVFNCEFTCTTDVPSHLFAHVSPEKPIIRRIPYQKRGANFELSSVTCFVETQTIEQDEAGDTLDHTFQIPFPLYDHVYYWYFTASQGGVACKSISQIFKRACSAPVGPIPRCCNIAAPYSMAGMSNCYDMATAFKPLTSYNCTSVDVQVCRSTSHVQCHAGRFFIFNADANGKPTSTVAGSYPFYIPDLVVGTCLVINIPITPVLLTAGNAYAISWGTTDRTINRWYYNTPRIAFGLASSPSCDPLPNHIYRRKFDRVKDRPCGHLVMNWQVYPHPYYLYYQTYGTDV